MALPELANGRASRSSWVVMTAKRKQKFTAGDRRFGFTRKLNALSAPRRESRERPGGIRLCAVLATERLSCTGGLSEMRKWGENGAVR
jgi:hypothetical protein